MSATAISSTPSFAEYAARWDWAMLPAPMTPTRNFVMRVSFTCGDRRSGEQVLGVGDPALAAQEAVLPALELDRGIAGAVGVADPDLGDQLDALVRGVRGEMGLGDASGADDADSELRHEGLFHVRGQEVRRTGSRRWRSRARSPGGSPPSPRTRSRHSRRSRSRGS